MGVTGGAGGEDAAPVISRAKVVGSRECWALPIPLFPAVISAIYYMDITQNLFSYLSARVCWDWWVGVIGLCGSVPAVVLLMSGIGRALLAVYICSQVMFKVRSSLAVDGIRVSCMFFLFFF